LLTGIALFAVLLIFLLTRAVTSRTKVLFRQQQAILGRLNGQVEESISGIGMVKAFGQEQEMVAKFVENNDAFCQVATKAQIASGYLMPMMNVINNLTYVLIAMASGIMAFKNRLTVGEISSFLLYSRQFSRPFVEIANIYNNFQTAVAGAERIIEILDESCEPEDVEGARSAAQVRGAVSFRDVTFGYRPDKPVLQHIDLEIEAGTRVAVVGPTGSGKTTLINLLTRFYDVQEGAILLDGCDLRQYRLGELRQAFGVVLQDTALFGTTIRENISYGHQDVPLEEVREAARVAGADGFIRRLPQGYETVLHQGGAELSQGERQLLTIARAVLDHAPIMILDEATSSVDTVTEQHIRQAMLAITQGRTSFIIAHRLSTIRDSDLILLIRDGQIAEQGTHQQLMDLQGEYARMYLTQMGRM
ncbi:MAG: ABC transporter ATP-binding protein/permease, partial [Acetatifactor sp.]|nr:ABC transporter ATP-binding protein/permease [Acetatifactor sp.]